MQDFSKCWHGIISKTGMRMSRSPLNRLRRSCGQNKDKSMFTGPILVFFQKYPQNRSKASKQCPMTIFDHQECSKPPDPGLEADLRISWLEGSISLDFAVRASRNISEMGIQNNTIRSENHPILYQSSQSKLTYQDFASRLASLSH